MCSLTLGILNIGYIPYIVTDMKILKYLYFQTCHYLAVYRYDLAKVLYTPATQSIFNNAHHQPIKCDSRSFQNIKQQDSYIHVVQYKKHFPVINLIYYSQFKMKLIFVLKEIPRDLISLYHALRVSCMFCA